MEINDELIRQWEPKIQRLLANTFVVGLDRDDIAQELRIAIIKAAKGFDEDRGVIFHTYLHTALETTLVDDEFIPSSILKALEDPVNTFEDIEFEDLISGFDITPVEKSFIILRLEGLTMDEISEDLETSAYKLRAALRDKLGALFE